MQVVVPQFADGDFRIIVLSDADGQVYEAQREANNSAGAPIALRHLDLRADSVSAPANAQSADTVHVDFDVTQAGSAALTGRWTDRVYLSRDTVLSGNDRLLGERIVDATLDAGATYRSEFDVTLPVDAEGDWFVLGVTDAGTAVAEVGAEGKQTAVSSLVSIGLAPYAICRLATSRRRRNDRGPGTHNRRWTVTNSAPAPALTAHWTTRWCCRRTRSRVTSRRHHHRQL